MDINFDYLGLIKEIAKYKKDEEYDILGIVHDQLAAVNLEQIKNDRRCWAKLRHYYAFYIDRTKLRQTAYMKLLFWECIKGLKVHLIELERQGYCHGD